MPDKYGAKTQAELFNELSEDVDKIIHPPPSYDPPLPMPHNSGGTGDHASATSLWFPVLLCAGIIGIIYYSGLFGKLLASGMTVTKLIGLAVIAALLLSKNFQKLALGLVAVCVLAFVAANVAVVAGLIHYQQPLPASPKPSNHQPSTHNAGKPKAKLHKQLSSRAKT